MRSLWKVHLILGDKFTFHSVNIKTVGQMWRLTKLPNLPNNLSASEDMSWYMKSFDKWAIWLCSWPSLSRTNEEFTVVFWLLRNKFWNYFCKTLHTNHKTVLTSKTSYCNLLANTLVAKLFTLKRYLYVTLHITHSINKHTRHQLQIDNKNRCAVSDFGFCLPWVQGISVFRITHIIIIHVA